METGINIVEGGKAYVSTDDRHMIAKIRKCMEQEPDGVRVIKEPKDNDGCWYGIIPASWIRIGLKRKNNMTDEQKRELVERMAKIRAESKA